MQLSEASFQAKVISYSNLTAENRMNNSQKIFLASIVELANGRNSIPSKYPNFITLPVLWLCDEYYNRNQKKELRARKSTFLNLKMKFSLFLPKCELNYIYILRNVSHALRSTLVYPPKPLQSLTFERLKKLSNLLGISKTKLNFFL